MASDGYERKRDCIHAIEQVKNTIKNRPSIHIEEMKNNQYRFTLIGNDQSIVGYSMPFNSEKQCTKWIKLMQEYIPASEIIELKNYR